MKVPSCDHVLGGELSCVPKEVSPRVAQAHFVKHVMGTLSLYGLHGQSDERVWNYEGWDRRDPAVLTVERRRELTDAIQGLEIEASRCKVDRLHKESYGGRAPKEFEPCYNCEGRLAAACHELCGAEVNAYFGFVDVALAQVGADVAERVSHSSLQDRALASLRSPAFFESLVVLSVHLRELRSGAVQPLVRLASASGVRTEFYLNGMRLSWRTTYGRPATTLGDKYRILVGESRPHGNSRFPLSDSVLVPRQWWVKP